MGENRYEREKIYKEVCAEPVTIVAKHYGVTDVALHKVCKRLNIPAPPRGYWARIRSGEIIKKTPLPPHKSPNVVYGELHEPWFFTLRMAWSWSGIYSVKQNPAGLA
ncbi:MAG: hypothetical protein A4E54_02241 [Pelotomaculum sp. PtaB.Bin117]|nr:MAG: hypothetical protein A4E54_02241 [Pelotomaculum sp. PtaB.Bin117]